jgi:hypothetical protein
MNQILDLQTIALEDRPEDPILTLTTGVASGLSLLLCQ